jgi:hypothetical protein
MKNIHVLPTDKPSRLHYFTANKAGYYLYPNNGLVIPRNPNCINQNIYITSDEEIKEGDWYLNNSNLVKCTEIKKRSSCKKIILTTDPELIKDGVQAIDDEFLEWFVKNPSCEEVEVFRDSREVGGHNGGVQIEYGYYEIIIIKEEPKQEKLEQIAEEFAIDFAEWCDRSKTFWTPTKELLEIYKKEKGL